MRLPALLRKRFQSGVLVATFFVVFLGVFLAIHPVHAGAFWDFLTGSASFTEVIMRIIGVILQGLIYLVGSLLLLVVNLFISIAQYTGFGEARAVNLGWAIVRDLTNMFFVLVMLVVAFGTILGVEEFSYRRMLPRLLIMAVLINFSKVIAGIFIDFSQVIMMTFVNGFAAVAGANIVSMLKINTYTQLNATETGASAASNLTTWDQVGGFFLGIVMMGIALAVVIIMMIILVFRIVMLWLLVIMSPLAFFASTFPRGRLAEAYGTWWKEFGNYLTIGPFMAFFLWLSFAVAGTGNIAGEGFPESKVPSGGGEGTRVNQFITAAGEPQNTLSYVIGIAMLMGGMMLSQQFSVLGGSMMGSAANYIKDKGTKIAKAPLKAAAFAAKDIDSRIAARTGISLNVPAYFRGAAKGLEERQASRYKAGLAKTAARAEKGGVLGRISQLAGDPEKFYKNYGIGGVAGIAMAPASAILSQFSSKFAPQSRKFYSDEAERYKGATTRSEGEIDNIQLGRSADVKSIMGGVRADVVDIRTQALDPTKSAAERTQLNDDANRLEQMANYVGSGKQMSRDQLAEMLAVSAKSTGNALGRKDAAGDFNTFEARETVEDQKIGQFKKKEEFYTEQALRAGPKGLPEEFGKHAYSGAETKGLADRARLDGSQEDFARVMRKAAGDDLDGHLEAEGFNANADGLKGYLEAQKKAFKMSEQQMLAIASEVSSVAKSKDPKYVGTSKMAAGGIMRWADNLEREVAQLKSKSAGKMRDGVVFGWKDKQGRSHMADSDIAAMARDPVGVIKTLMNPKGVSAAQLAVFAENKKQIIDRVGTLIKAKNPQEFKRLVDALDLVENRLAAMPAKLSDQILAAKATK